MAEFLHEVIAQRESTQQPVYSQQYTPLYRGVFIQAQYNYVIYNVPSIIRNVQKWWDSPTERLMRAVFSTLGCEHRWVFDINHSHSVRYMYYCMDCRSEQTQHIREDRE
jgi:hypothetical protein